jgi:Pyridoxamine 5'-phosphate oxidase
MEPRVTRPDLPAGYGTDQRGEAVPWPRVEEWISSARNYWLCSTRPDGRRHAKPVWALWVDDALVFSTHSRTVAGRNFAANPAISVHVDSAEQVAILEGTVERVRDRELLRRISRLEEEKYGWQMSEPDPHDPNDAFYRLRPRRVLAWHGDRRIGETITRFEFRQD